MAHLLILGPGPARRSRGVRWLRILAAGISRSWGRTAGEALSSRKNHRGSVRRLPRTRARERPPRVRVFRPRCAPIPREPCGNREPAPAPDPDGPATGTRRAYPPRGDSHHGRPQAGDRGRPQEEGKPALRRVKRVVRHVDPFSVLKISLLFYAAFLLVWLLMVAIFYNILNSIGLFEAIDAVRESFVLGEGEDHAWGGRAVGFPRRAHIHRLDVAGERVLSRSSTT